MELPKIDRNNATKYLIDCWRAREGGESRGAKSLDVMPRSIAPELNVQLLPSNTMLLFNLEISKHKIGGLSGWSVNYLAAQMQIMANSSFEANGEV